MTSPAIARLTEELQASCRRLEGIARTSASARPLARFVNRLAQRLARPPRIVLLGEFNSGKTTLANSLIGADVLPTSILANTRIPLLIKYSSAPTVDLELSDGSRRPLTEEAITAVSEGRADMLVVGLPVERLKSFELIDTPGLASGITRLDRSNLYACRRANIALWCTASNQAWKATEREAWLAVPSRLRRNGLLIATLADALNSMRERERVEARLRHEAAPSFSDMVMVTAADIDELRRNPLAEHYDDRWIESGGAALDEALDRIVERVMRERQDATTRILTRTAERMERNPAKSVYVA